ncbi:sn-glycerol-1-phosphate dehydrogenase [Cohnella sp. JJ-181]|uniref:sn-glycerol-1-phosphate dehydrogenase n=1 Tax=Cohnella rhizoplanae TaxID=2974897 RepID=UPI0022FF6173|nr:sn-glycerol-1-phosphate dehydrogenase [Cohnella sp. JJ-181]CAI6083874.1 Glycerol-1-phosphate dehydrogenase [NAD(P)+] [Cohnella sp. JJ-181]
MNHHTDIIASVIREAEARGIRLEGVAFPDEIVLEPGAIARLPAYLSGKGHKRALLVGDPVTIAAAGGEGLAASLRGLGIETETTLVTPNAAGDVVADEASVVQALLDMQKHRADVAVAVGAGTLHDITRYAAYTSGLPFVSAPTAPSVDGFTSKGAPLLIRGDKITVPAIGPSAIFADTDILAQAPAAMVAAGFGDMLGKYTSLFDWKVGHAIGGEDYDPFVAELTGSALDACVSRVEAIGGRTPEGIETLTRALIVSGLAMLIFGQSHSASGAEHHLSHYWEMELLRTGRRQVLHGAKVGAACAIIADHYRRRLGQAAEAGASGSDAALAARLGDRLPEIAAWLGELPGAARIRELLRIAGGPAEPEALGIDAELVLRSLREADEIRPGRKTLLRLINGRP